MPNDIYDQTIFEHPIFNLDTLYAQKNMNKIQGNSNTWFCGSYCGYGFHEDGIQSSVYISKLLGSEILWNRSSNFINRIGFNNND